MPFKVTFEGGGFKLPKVDARELVALGADAAILELSRSLVEGYDPATGAPRGENDQGKPIGYRTGRLAEGLRRGEISGDQRRATATISPPADRRGWVISRGDILTTAGTVAEQLQATTDDYTENA